MDTFQLSCLTALTYESTWLSESYALTAGTTDDLIPEYDAVNLILRLNAAVDTAYIKQKLKVCILLLSYSVYIHLTRTSHKSYYICYI